MRAIAIAEERDYDSVYDELAALGRKSGAGTDKKLWQALLNGRHRKESFPAVAGQNRVTVSSFATKFPEGRWIVQCAGHLLAVIDGYVYDDGEPRMDACVYAAWLVSTASDKPESKGRQFKVVRYGVHTRVRGGHWMGRYNIKSEDDARAEYQQTIRWNRNNQNKDVEIRLAKAIMDIEVLEVQTL